MQHEITQAIPLLDGQGNLTQPGWARGLLPIYCRSAVRGGATRLKEWDYYLVTDGRLAVALTIADNSYMGLDSISLLDFQAGWQVTRSPMRLLPMGRTGLPQSSAGGHSASSGRGYGLFFRHSERGRLLTAHMDSFRDGEPLDVQIALTDEPAESIVVCTPFEKPGHFYYNQKINCLRATGRVNLGSRVYEFRPENTFGTLDWGRGVWTYHNTWYWASASGMVDGVPFGLNLGYGFGDTAAASENILFYGGRGHKLSQVTFHIPKRGGRNHYMGPWRFTSDDGRLTLDFRPVMDRAACTSAVVVKSDQHQVFGRFTGTAVLDDGRVLELRDLFGFAERVENRW